MNALVLEDDFFARMVLQRFLLPYGECHVAVNGIEAMAAFQSALESGQAYDLVCLDILVPEMDGHEVLKAIRAAEEKRGILPGKGAKIIMVTALDDMKNVMRAYQHMCNGYLTKPITRTHLVAALQEVKLVPGDDAIFWAAGMAKSSSTS